MKTPLILVNFKTYSQATGKDALKLAKACDEVAAEHSASIAVAPQFLDAQKIVDSVDIPVLAQHVDNVSPGSHTGFILPESLKETGLAGSLLNHSEHRIRLDLIEDSIQRLRKLGILSVVCSNNIATTSAIASLKPDFVAIEPPELIGSGISVSDAQPEIIEGAVKAVQRITKKLPVLCGAGITKGADVKKSIQLGAKGVLVASGVVKAEKPEKVLTEFVKYMQAP